MKKIILGLVSLLALTTSCSKHEIEPMSVQQMKDAEYEVAFTNVFGDYDKTHDWGFSRASVAQTRTVVKSDMTDYPLFSAWVLDKSVGFGWANK